MSVKSLKELVTKDFWQKSSERLKNEEIVEVLQELFDYIVGTLRTRIDDIKTDDGKAIYFFSKGREFLTINVTRKDLRIYIHPPAKAIFDPESKFKVEKFRFWEGSYHKKSNRFKAMSIWVSEKRYLSEVKKIINYIPKTIKEEKS
ncbi:MAG: hypothetical protein AMJ90_04360 [candidate division Zixibacteria bacterium SM23_73_2]|nr:MAG: hypothetical protein AMJ90_04360 [candidate division Zixibacteria bacterium SM23_73_2]